MKKPPLNMLPIILSFKNPLRSPNTKEAWLKIQITSSQMAVEKVSNQCQNMLKSYIWSDKMSLRILESPSSSKSMMDVIPSEQSQVYCPRMARTMRECNWNSQYKICSKTRRKWMARSRANKKNNSIASKLNCNVEEFPWNTTSRSRNSHLIP